MAAGSKKVIIAALIGNALISVTKFAASAFTGSSAMFSEGAHSLVDTANQGLLLHGMRRAKRPASPGFPFGHGKEVYFWSFIVAILIFAAGAGVSLYEGVHGLADPHPVSNPYVNYAVLVLAMLFEGVAWYMALREFRHEKGDLGYFQAVRRGKDPTIFVVLFEDSAAMLGLVVAFTGVVLGHVTGDWRYDSYAAIAIAMILAGTAVWLAFETKSLLIGEGAGKDVVEEIRRRAGAAPGVEHVNEVLTLHMGPDFLLVNISVDFADACTADEVESAVAALDADVKQAFPEIKRVFVEAEARRRNIAQPHSTG